MMILWMSVFGLLVLAFLFIVWPLWRYRHTRVLAAINDTEVDQRLAENVRIFREHLAELDNNLASGAIDEKQFAQLKVELERNLLDDEASLRALNIKSSSKFGIKTATAFCASVLLGGVLFYEKQGSAADVQIYSLQTEKMQQDYKDVMADKQPDPARARDLIEKYKSRLKDEPDNLQHWFLLARTQMEIGSYADAVKSYQEVLTRDSKSAMVMAELAQAMFLRDRNQMTPPIVDLAKNAYTLDPKNTMALGLLGIDAYSRKDYRETIRYWQKSIELMGPDSSGSIALSAGIEKAKQSYIAEGGKLEDLQAKSAYTVKLEVSLGAAPKVTQDQVVFVYARAWQGSPMPLAIARIKVRDLPTTIQLDETMAMSPAASLATATDIEVIARVSPSGSAKAEIGDWLGKKGPISMKSVPEVIQVEINEQFAGDAAKSK
ncbi:MAG: c-type cytochrome biogenesis protein CcmI [Gammaproteobacteria bacterium]|nr:MAG: c-type cytochrome biogenesis protein CcmI [Gammaproteobacteria bacterium]